MKAGNRENINARKNTWIPNLASGRITSNITYDSSVKSNTLILPLNNWDTEKLNNLFLPYKVEVIQ